MFKKFKKIKKSVFDFFKTDKVILFFILAAISFFITFVVNLNVSSPFKVYKIGEFADRNIKSPQTIQIENKEATEKAKLDAENSTPPVFDYDPELLNQTKQKVHNAFSYLRQNPFVQGGKRSFEEQVGKLISDDIFTVFQKSKFSWRFERAIMFALNSVPRKYIVEDKDVIFKEGLEEIFINKLSTQEKEQKRVKTFHLFQNVDTVVEVKQLVKTKMEQILTKFNKKESKALVAMVSYLISPNLTLNKQSTLDVKKNARERVKSVIIQINKGEIIVRDGEPIEKHHLLIFSALRKARTELKTVIYFLFHFLLLLLTFYCLVAFAKAFWSYSLPKFKDLIALGTMMIIYALVIKMWYFLSFLLTNTFPHIPYEVFFLLFPYLSIVLLTRVLLNPEISLLMAIASCFVVGILSEGNFLITAYALLSGLISVVFVIKFEERSVLLKAGLLTGIFQMFLTVVIMFSKVYTVGFSWDQILTALLMGFLSGMLGTLVVEAVVPVLEYVFNYTTNIKLLEFANTNHPLLQDLLIKAPGTYQHSMVVGQLASAGANAIGVNALLARVGSYFHDIGKMNKSLYFIENQQGISNPHDKLNPTMSSRILVSHVKDGVKLGKEYKLGKPIIDIIEQHHGTSLMKFFYAKAQELGLQADELDYRYPGQKPKTREAVLVMIADSAEAACRSLDEPNAVRIQTTVENLINKMFADGQFDQSNITLRRLRDISNVYTKILIALHHTRIEYPAENKAEENSDGDTNYRRKGGKNSPKITDSNSRDSIIESGL